MGIPGLIVEFTAEERARAAGIAAEFTPEEHQRATELYATIAELGGRQTKLAASLVAARAANNKRARVKQLDRKLRAIATQTESVLAELTDTIALGIERAKTDDGEPILAKMKT